MDTKCLRRALQQLAYGYNTEVSITGMNNHVPVVETVNGPRVQTFGRDSLDQLTHSTGALTYNNNNGENRHKVARTFSSAVAG